MPADAAPRFRHDEGIASRFDQARPHKPVVNDAGPTMERQDPMAIPRYGVVVMDVFQATMVKLAAAATLCVTVALATLFVSPGNAATIESRNSLAAEQRTTVDQDSAELQQRFAGAPDGVDPVVTGPVSAAFKEKRAFLNCDDAVWPQVPAGCYPD